MPKVSKRKVTKEGKLINNFWRVVTFLDSKDEVKNFLKALLTPTEMLMLAKRIEITRLLMRDEHYAYIGKEVKVANATITHVNGSLSRGGYKGYLKPLQRLEDKDFKQSHGIGKRPKRIRLKSSAFSREIAKAAGRETVRQYRKWKKFKTASA